MLGWIINDNGFQYGVNAILIISFWEPGTA